MTADRSERLSGFGNVYVLLLLVAVNIVNYADRTLIAVLTQPIKADLGLSDTQIGIISGVAFAAMFSLSGLLLARFADRFSRTRMLAAAIALWSLMCLLTATAGGFWQLCAIRLGLGIGESAAVPTAYALIYTAFTARTRSSAYGLFLAGATIGLGTGVGIGGWLGEAIGWRQTMAMVAIPGFAIALLVALTIREPARPAAQVAHRPIAAIFLTVLRTPILVALIGALALQGVANAGFAQWAPAFYMRVHHMALGDLGRLYALSSSGGALIGLIAGGTLVGRAVATNERLGLLLCGLLNLLAGFASAAAFTVGDRTLSLVLFALFGVTAGSVYAPTVAIFQRYVPDDARALASAIMMLFVINLGHGGGPFVIGLVSDRLATTSQAAVLGAAMMVGSVALLLSALAYVVAARVIARQSQEA